MFVFHTPYLTLPQVFGWILERDTERVRQVPENMTISILHLQHVDRHLNAACTVITAPDVDLSKLANIEPNDAPPKDSELRNYLTQHDVGPDQLPKLKPKSLASFGAALLDYLEGWYAAAGSSPDDAAALADRYLHELDDWFAAQGFGPACSNRRSSESIISQSVRPPPIMHGMMLCQRYSMHWGPAVSSRPQGKMGRRTLNRCQRTTGLV